MSDIFGLIFIILVNVIFYGLIIVGIATMINKRSKNPEHAFILVAMIVCFVVFAATIVQKVMYRDWRIDATTAFPLIMVVALYISSRRKSRLQSK